MKDIKIQIPEMQSAHCQTRVKKAITSVDGVVITELEPGQVVISISDDSQSLDVIKAINEAGYKTSLDSNDKAGSESEVLLFKTNINCGGCISKVSNSLNSAEGICHWDVNINSPEKILAVYSTGISREGVIEKVQNAGFEIELYNS